jgi:hypothetical protein
MVYIERKIDADFLKIILRVVLELQGEKIVFWKYLDIRDDSNTAFWDEIKPYYAGKQKLENVTQYNDYAKMSEKVDYYKFNQDIEVIMRKHYDTLVDVLDSVSIYKKNDNKWLACLIFHEKMTLLRKSSTTINVLNKNNIVYTNKPPDWW